MIIDASVVFKWIADEDGTDRAMALIGLSLAAPILLLSEIGNALRKKAIRDQIDARVDFSEDLIRLAEIVELRDERAVIGRALAMSRQIVHPIYDCVYLALAEQDGVQLVTADRKFVEKLAATPWRAIVTAL